MIAWGGIRSGVARALAMLAGWFKGRVLFALACAILVSLYLSGAPRPFDNGLSQMRSAMLHREPTQSLVVVEIDTPSLHAAGQWPWPRERFAQAIHNLREAGAELVAFDVDFSARSTERDDEAMREAISIEPATVVLPTFVQSGGEFENFPLSNLSEDAVVASVNIPIDSDGRVRRYPRGFLNGERYHASMASVLAGAPYGATGTFLIDYSIDLDSIPHLSFQQVYEGDFDPALVRGKSILVGATALELGDELVTPIRPTVPGVYVHALAYESLVQGRTMVRLSDTLILTLALGMLALMWPRRPPINLLRVIGVNLAVSGFVLGATIALQAAAPVVFDIGWILLAQIFCVAASIQKELAYRASELVRQREEHLTYLAFHDSENNLPNRRALVHAMASLKQQSEHGALAVIVIGVERFSMLRGAIGYANANKVVAALAAELSARSGATVHHLSTSLLGLTILHESEEAARAFCNDCKGTDAAIQVDGQSVDVDFRIGASIAPAADADAEKLLEQATVALDYARAWNRHHVLFDATEIPDPKKQLALLSDIGKGLARGEFHLVYQPKADARSGTIIGAEALTRWTHPEHGIVPPESFIDAAEKTGAIDELTIWALGQAIADQATLRQRGVAISISVNLSGRSLTDTAFCRQAIDMITAADADICFEITETAIIDDHAAALAAMNDFRAAGIKISIDDYGSGLSSLGYLKQIAANELKIDKSLIVDLAESATDRLIVKSTVELAHGLGMAVVAEGIESAQVQTIAAALGCDAIQGYLVSRPLGVGGLAALCADSETQRRAASA